MINRLQETNQPVAVQETTFSVDVMGRFICNTWDEAVNNGGVAFDAVVIGAGMFGAYCAGGVPTVDSVNDHDIGAPLSVQAAQPASGLFSFDKYSSAPILTEAIREAAGSPDWRRRLFLVPRAHVVKLHTGGGLVTQIEGYVN